MDIKNLLCTYETTTTTTDTLVFDHHKYTNEYDNHFKSYYSPLSSIVSSPVSSIASSPSPILDSPPHSPSPSSFQNNNHTKKLNSRTPWSSEEDFLLQKGYEQGLSWAMISSTYLPHRSRGCCWGRFKTLQTKALEQREWSDPEDRLLLLAIKKHTKLFKHAWKSVAQDLGHRSSKECEIRFCKIGNMIRKRQ
ncbi:unnamed protein product [Cunninghamella echinulata]